MLRLNQLSGFGAGKARLVGNDSYTKALLNGDGADTSTTIVNDAAGGSTAWTARGNAQIDTGQVPIYGLSSIQFDGTGDFLDTPAHADYQPGSAPFSIDMWVNVDNFSDLRTVFFYANDGNTIDGQVMYFNTAGKLTFRFLEGSSASSITAANAVLVNEWTHIYASRSGTTAYVAINGVMETATITARNIGVPNLDADSIPQIGRYYGPTYERYLMVGHIKGFRYSKGVVRWTEDFPVPTRKYGP